MDRDEGNCPHHALDTRAEVNFVGDLTFTQFSMIISGISSGLTIVIMLSFKQMHALHLSNPSQQVKIMRTGTMITMYALVSFLCVCFPSSQVYIHPWLDVVEGLALGSFFLLMCEYISPVYTQQEAFFNAKRKGGGRWFKTRWWTIFQFPVISLVVAVLTDILAALEIYCEWSNEPRNIRFWLLLIGNISLLISIISILLFYNILKVDLAHHQPFAKLFSFKAVVGLTFVQGIIIWILSDAGVIGESDRFTFADVHIRFPNMIVCVEMLPLSIGFIWAYPWRVYLVGGKNATLQSSHGEVQFSKPYQGGPFGIYAWLYLVNPSDIIRAIIFGAQQSFGRGRRQGRSSRRQTGTEDVAGEDQPLRNYAA